MVCASGSFVVDLRRVFGGQGRCGRELGHLRTQHGTQLHRCWSWRRRLRGGGGLRRGGSSSLSRLRTNSHTLQSLKSAQGSRLSHESRESRKHFGPKSRPKPGSNHSGNSVPIRRQKVQNQVLISGNSVPIRRQKSARAALTIPKESSSGVNTPSPFLSNAANSSSSACEPWAAHKYD